MAYTLKKKRANRSNYGGKRSTQKIKYIPIHFTSNDGDTDEANGRYFASHVIKASAHFFVDDDSVTESVPADYVAYAVGGKKYTDCKKTGGGKYFGKCTNSNSLSIEICDDIRNGVVYPSEKTIENALALTKELMKKYNVPQSRVIRHFDVTGKKCPGYWCGSKEKDKKWKTEFWDRLVEDVPKKDNKKKSSTKKKTEFEPYTVKITSKTLNLRQSASQSSKAIGLITGDQKLLNKNPDFYFPRNASYTIVEERMNGKTKWGKLKSGYWISLNYTKKI